MAQKLHSHLLPYRDAMILLADPDRAKGQSAYMRNQFPFFGVGVPELRSTAKGIMKQGLPDRAQLPAVVRSAWAQPEREFQLIAIWMVKAMKKEWDDDLVPLLEFMITHKSWWDSVDGIASDITGPFFHARRSLAKSVTQQWNRSENIWLQRSSLLFMKTWKKDLDKAILEKHIARLTHSREFFVQKAIGWILREHARVDPRWVREFVVAHQDTLPALSKREALKHLA